MANGTNTATCQNCGAPIPKGAEVCMTCGAKQKPPIYKRWWVILLAVILVVGVVTSIKGKIKDNGEKFNWEDMALCEVLPEPESNRGKIHMNSEDGLQIDVLKTSDKQYNDYINACREKGFTVDEDKGGTSFEAYNEDGYKLKLSYYSGQKEMSIDLEVPEKLGNLRWPKSEMASLIPVPESTEGKVEWEYSTGFAVSVGKTSLEDFNEYVDACADMGFTVDYSRGEDYYYANNEDGYSLSVNYQGNNVMFVSLDQPYEEPESSDKPDEAEASEPSAFQEPSPEPSSESKLVDGMRSEFKEAMDAYEAFYDEYCEFMEAYKKNPSDLKLISQYSDMLTKLTEVDEKFAKWDNGTMNDAESKYYLEVNARVLQKLASVSG